MKYELDELKSKKVFLMDWSPKKFFIFKMELARQHRSRFWKVRPFKFIFYLHSVKIFLLKIGFLRIVLARRTFLFVCPSICKPYQKNEQNWRYLIFTIPLVSREVYYLQIPIKIDLTQKPDRQIGQIDLLREIIDLVLDDLFPKWSYSNPDPSVCL